MADVEAAIAGARYVALADPSDAAAAYLRSEVREAQVGFARRVYGIRVAQLALTVAIAVPIHQIPTEWLPPSISLPLVTLAYAGTMASFLRVMYGDFAEAYPRNYLLLFGFTVSQALLIGLVSTLDTTGMLMAYLALLAVILLCLMAYMWIFRLCVMGVGAYVQGGIITVVVLGLAELFLPQMEEPKVMARKLEWILLFTFLVVFDTQSMLGAFSAHRIRFDVDDFVSAVMLFYVGLLVALCCTFTI